MNKKLKFLSVMFLLLFARGCDFYSTSLWIFQEGGLEHETNPLTQIFGVGWNGLIVVNVIVVALVSYCFYIYMFKYKIVVSLNPRPKTPIQYASILYYGQKNKIWKLLYKIPTNRFAAIAHTGYIGVWGIIFASFLVTIHNLLQFYDNPYYDIYLDFVKYPMFIFYTLIFSSLIYILISLYQKEFHEYINLGK